MINSQAVAFSVTIKPIGHIAAATVVYYDLHHLPGPDRRP